MCFRSISHDLPYWDLFEKLGGATTERGAYGLDRRMASFVSLAMRNNK